MTDQYAELRSRINTAIRRIIRGEGAMRLPVDPADPDVVLVDCRWAIDKLLDELDALLDERDALLQRLREIVESVEERDREIEALRERFDFTVHLRRQREWSGETFGPGPRAEGIVDHIVKELAEILNAPNDLGEWIDVVILALDGAWREGYSPEQIIAALVAKQEKNESRTWPDWRTAEPGKAIEHVRDAALENEKEAE